jgi:hypothetical protein
MFHPPSKAFFVPLMTAYATDDKFMVDNPGTDPTQMMMLHFSQLTPEQPQFKKLRMLFTYSTQTYFLMKTLHHNW